MPVVENYFLRLPQIGAVKFIVLGSRIVSFGQQLRYFFEQLNYLFWTANLFFWAARLIIWTAKFIEKPTKFINWQQLFSLLNFRSVILKFCAAAQYCAVRKLKMCQKISTKQGLCLIFRSFGLVKK
jgi:hypothetical protein